MCGIFGYVGRQRSDLSSLLLRKLSKLDYRGYDSAGIAVLHKKHFQIRKSVGEVNDLKSKLRGIKISGAVGIGHTRWATHGGVSVKNAHPHKDCSGNIVVVHNGIVENFEVLKKDLLKKGHRFTSDTDTEVFAHLVEEESKSKNFLKAVRDSFKKLKGLNAIVVANNDGELVGLKRGSPLVLGVKGEEKFISSDTPLLSDITSRIFIIEEDEGIYINNDVVKTITLGSDKKSVPKFRIIKINQNKVEKKGFKHYLLKEIYEQPQVVMNIADNNKQNIMETARMIKDAWGTYFTACGTAAHAGLAATYMFSEIAERHVNFSFGSEFPYYEDFLVERSLLIAASQSGETMDTLEAVRAAKRHGSKVLALVNVPGSSLERISDKTLYLNAGPERAVLSTKAYIAKLSLFLLISYSMLGEYEKGVSLLRRSARSLKRIFNVEYQRKLKRLSKRLMNKDHIYIIGRGLNYPTALEGALKIKEASYIHAEGFAGGELKHGVIALVEKGTPCICIVAEDRAKEAILSNAMELKSRGAEIIGISPKKYNVFDFHLEVEDVSTASPIVNIVPMQLMAYYITILKDLNPDKPRNLAKSVTVK
ncbi:glutamine--fructose-6-phosphate transaminase (isomerizing) [Candidatus Woesebacteria bacterium]|nr:glutamine--fructose-6-phosphate transaminase (isomerizing) [Candidatus Woesebacteria bacterium]